ncbi:hypothetical protein C0995_010329 [Termitomyces sp. Mi166|nr:hypothetical protein C0995_010329 [Termitomyces sp. Mi166\
MLKRLQPLLLLKQPLSQPAAFQRLTQALERHKASLTARVHHYPPLPEPAHTIDISELGSAPQIPSSHTPQIRPSLSGMQREESSPSPLGRTSPHHYVPGNYIDATERAGLPGSFDPLNVAQEQAQKVVDSHTRKRRLGDKLKLGRRWDKMKRVFDGGQELDDNDNTDVERNGGIETLQMRGRGVLSTLLSLYGQEPDLPSGMSTPGGYSFSFDGSPDFDRPCREDHPRPLHCPGSKSLSDSRHSHRATEVTPESPGLSRQSTLLGTEPKESKLQQFAASSLLHRHRNSKTRSGAGVFGPLIASTGNLTSVVAPTQSQLQPDIKRPGYRLSRYSFDEKPQLSNMNSRVPSRIRCTYDDTSSYAPSLLSAASSPPSPTATDPGSSRSKWVGMLKDMSVPSIRSFGGRSGTSTPARSTSPLFEEDGSLDWRQTSEAESWKEKKRKRKRARVFITRHVAHILERQAFILKFARAMMMFGAPSHRLQSQITSTAHVLELEMSCVYFPDVLLVSFDDSSTSTSNVKVIRQGSSLDLVKLADAYKLYWKVIYDKLSVSDASAELDNIMRRPQLYSWWKLVFFGGMCSSSICTVSFDGSLLDALVVFPMGALLIIIQLLSVRNELYSNVFEVTVTTLFSFIAAALAASRRFCYSAVASSSVVLILPGFIVLNGALELMSRNIVAGSVRLCYAIVYAIFLGFGLAMGAKAFVQITGKEIVGSTDIVCSISHYEGAPWYQQKPSKFWVGIVANMYARLFKGNAFVVMITGILFQVPSGLGSGGLLNYVSLQTHGDSNSYLSGFQTALKLVSVDDELVEFLASNPNIDLFPDFFVAQLL